MAKLDREKLIVENLALVHFIIWKYFPGYGRDEDMFQTGCIGLIRAANKFDPDRDIEFSTYASRAIRNEIGMHLRKLDKRKKIKMISIQEPVNDDQNIEDVLIGETGIDTFDLEPFIKKLTKLERDYVVLAIRGYNKTDIARENGVSKSYVTLIFKRIHKKWDDTYGTKQSKEENKNG